MPTKTETEVDRAIETREWLESLEAVVNMEGRDRAVEILRELQAYAHQLEIPVPPSAQTPYINTIPPEDEPPYPGDLRIEANIRHLVRWNALAMVLRANRDSAGIGGHISTFASCATLYEVGLTHFFRGRHHPCGGDQIYFQGHASPGNYAHAFLEGRITEQQLDRFRHETKGDGLSSYPHPWLMPDFWEFPTVSMGLGPIQAIYRARFMHYLEDRGLRDKTDAKVWAFIGDGEIDEPETMGAISLAAREKLDNLTFVVNCNLQRLDGPVRGNGQIIQELETAFGSIGWNVIKVVWANEWDPLFAKDTDGALIHRLSSLLDGEFQRSHVEGGAYIREKIFGGDPALRSLVEQLSDEDLAKLRVGGHDFRKVFAAYDAAAKHTGSPTVILAQTVKGYGLGTAGEGLNISHQQKKLDEDELKRFRDRFHIPISDEKLSAVPFHRPPDDSAEVRYLKEHSQLLGGSVPERKFSPIRVSSPDEKIFDELLEGNPRPVATTMAIVRLLSKLISDRNIGRLIVPIVPDEARTFGMDSLFRQCGIYSSIGQLYEPVDAGNLMYYREAKNGQLLEEGITEAGSMSSFIAAGTAYAYHGVNTLPFFFFYSMFGFQRIGDLIWAAGDIRAHGFLIGATAGRTTLAGEGLQHQDGHSHLLAMALPNLKAYDPAFAYEIAIIVKEGIRRMHQKQEDLLYYITVGNELYEQPKMPVGVEEEGILKGIYRFKQGQSTSSTGVRPQLFGSGAILNEVLRAQKILSDKFSIATDVWSATSYNELRHDALDVERWNSLHPDREPRQPYLTRVLDDALGDTPGIFIAASDYMKALPDSIAKWLPGPLITLGTDGFGRSGNREDLREFFEVNAEFIAWTCLAALNREGAIDQDILARAASDLGIDPEKPNPSTQ